jgi:hypothetical protein
MGCRETSFYLYTLPVSTLHHIPQLDTLSHCRQDNMSSGVSPSETLPASKRRKVRKGTQSCWECKRRKVRCIFALPTNLICDNCVRRKTACISQEYIDEADSLNKRAVVGVEARLRKIEDALGQIANTSQFTDDLVRNDSYDCSESATATLVGSDISLCSQPEANQSNCSNDAHSSLSLENGYSPACFSHSPDVPLIDGYTGVARKLVAAWPSQHDLERIYKLPVPMSTISHMHLDSPISTGSSWKAVSSQEILHLPPPGSHPVLIARKLLFLGSLLQGTLSSSSTMGQTRKFYRKIMSRVIDTATRLVTTADDLTASIEGIECIMIEAMLQNHTGELHRSWQTVRRATTVAQLMGLHRNIKIPPLKIFDKARRDDYNLDQLYCRIIEMDRYLSLTLGLPQSSLEIRTISAEALAQCQPLERMARLQCIVAGKILTRKREEVSGESVAFRLQIESLLQQAANEMPPQWWLIPDHESDSANSFQGMIRVNYQFVHYHLLVRLHLPYMLRSGRQDANDYSTIAATSASREMLSRYMAFRRWNSGQFYCRGTDFLAFICLIVMCLAHINSRISNAGSGDTISGIHVTGSLTQSYLSDRGMMERVVEVMKRMKNDAIASKLTHIMQHLLDVEMDTANGVEYEPITTDVSGEAIECDGDFVDGKRTFRLLIPYIGTIYFRRKICSKQSEGSTETIGLESTTAPMLDVLSEQTMRREPFSGWDFQWSQQHPPLTFDTADSQNIDTELYMFDDTFRTAPQNDWTLQSINESLFSSLFSGLDNHGTA